MTRFGAISEQKRTAAAGGADRHQLQVDKLHVSHRCVHTYLHVPKQLDSEAAAKMPLRGPVPVKLYKKETAEVLKLGPMTCYVFEDGSNTDNRVGCITLVLPPGASGPPMHWHRFHDECFLVTKGVCRP